MDKVQTVANKLSTKLYGQGGTQSGSDDVINPEVQ